MFAKQARLLMSSIYSIEKGIYHYKSMAKTNYRGYLREPIVPLKKYFYVLRPLLAILWLQQNKECAPIEFDQLRTLIADNKPLAEEIQKLRKKASLEKQTIEAIPIINTFIEEQLQRLENYAEKPYQQKEHFDLLNGLFHQAING